MFRSIRLAAQGLLCLGLALGTVRAPAAADDVAVKGAAVTAQGDAKSTPLTSMPTAGPLVPAPYLLAADDALSITVINFANLSTMVVVPPDGNITVPLLDPLPITGMTTVEVAQLLRDKWKRFVINPSVSVTLTQKRRQSVVFYGQVTRVGPAEYRAGLHLIEALAEAGGTPTSADLNHVVVTHGSGQKQVLDLSHPEKLRGTERDVPLQVGDIVFVPEKHTQVSVVGEVYSPGSLEYKEGMTVLEALKGAGGVRLESADLSGATLTHDGTAKPLNLDDLLRHGDTRLNTHLEPGDSLLIPEIRNRTYVFGAVGKAGFYNFKPGDRILDAMTGVGGPTPQADLSCIHIIHIKPDKTVAGVEQVDLNKFLKAKKADLKYNVALGPGDVLYVPERKKSFSLTDLFGVLSGFSLLRSLSGR
jgi:polysaccharide export outer membrane protein